MANLAKYGSYSIEQAEAEAASVKGGNRKFWKAQAGESWIRIPPPPIGKNTPFQSVWEHFIERPDGEKKSFACPRKMVNQPCPICEYAHKMTVSGNPADNKVGKRYQPRQRVHFHLLDRKEPEKGLQVWNAPSQILEDLTKIRKNPNVGGDFCHPTEGFDICIMREGTGQNDTKYKVFPARQSSPLHPKPEKAEELIEAQTDLSDRAQCETYAEMKTWLEGGGGSGGGDGKSADKDAPF